MHTNIIDYKKRWGVFDEPNGERFIKKREVTKSIINGWDDFNESEKKILLNIKTLIQEILKDSEVALYGSRVKGYWIENSDYDIMVFGISSKEEQEIIRKIKFDFKVDFLFLQTEIIQNTVYIKIP
jgi:predicted nucleotidyltransferase